MNWLFHSFSRPLTRFFDFLIFFFVCVREQRIFTDSVVGLDLVTTHLRQYCTVSTHIYIYIHIQALTCVPHTIPDTHTYIFLGNVVLDLPGRGRSTIFQSSLDTRSKQCFFFHFFFFIVPGYFLFFSFRVIIVHAPRTYIRTYTWKYNNIIIIIPCGLSTV